jgi:hypothetical protein
MPGVGSNAFNFGLVLNSILGIKPAMVPFNGTGPETKMTSDSLPEKIFHVPRLNGPPFGLLRIDARKFARVWRLQFLKL